MALDAGLSRVRLRRRGSAPIVTRRDVRGRIRHTRPLPFHTSGEWCNRVNPAFAATENLCRLAAFVRRARFVLTVVCSVATWLYVQSRELGTTNSSLQARDTRIAQFKTLRNAATQLPLQTRPFSSTGLSGFVYLFSKCLPMGDYF